MALTKFDFLNEYWEYVQEYPFNTLNTREKEKIEILRIGKEIETILERLFLGVIETDFFTWDFEKVWIELAYDYQFNAAKEEFLQQIKRSLDVNKMIDLRIEELEIEDFETNNELTYSRLFREDYGLCTTEALGYYMAIKGSNPIIKDLIFNNGYNFDKSINELLCINHLDPYCKQIYEVLKNETFDGKIDNLHRVCKGYSRAKMVYFLKDYKKEIRNKTNAVESTIKEEPLPSFEYKGEAQKIAWLHELGILETIINQCKEDGTIIWSRAANIISSFTCINADTIRKCLQAIYQTNEGNKKNNPLNNEDNRLFVADMAIKFKLNKNK